MTGCYVCHKLTNNIACLQYMPILYTKYPYIYIYTHNIFWASSLNVNIKKVTNSSSIGDRGNGGFT